MNAEQALDVLDWWIEANDTNRGRRQQKVEMDEALEKARAFFADLVDRDALQRNALEHIANTCPGRAAEVARAGLSEPRELQA